MRAVLDLFLVSAQRDLPQCLRGWALFLALALVSAGCGSSAHKDFDLNRGEPTGPNAEVAAQAFADATNQGAEKEWRYLIQGGDQLEVVFFTHPAQNRFVKVRPDGYVTLPYLGDVRAEGKTPEQLAGELQETYAEVLVSPRVDVIVQEMGARFYVLGQVPRPGEFAYERRVDILQALAQAGGYTNSARLSNIVLLRKGGDSQQSFAAILDLRDYMASDNRDKPLELRPYDIVWVPRNNVSRWDVATRQSLLGILNGQDVVVKGWSLANFEEVFERQRF